MPVRKSKHGASLPSDSRSRKAVRTDRPKKEYKTATPTGEHVDRGQYSDEETEVLRAVNKERSKLNRFLTVTEIFQVVKGLGYKR